MKKNLLLFLLSILIGENTYADSSYSYFLCETEGEEKIFGHGKYDGISKFSQKVIVSIDRVNAKAYFFKVQPVDSCDDLFRCNSFSNLFPEKLISTSKIVETDTEIEFANKYKRDISIWFQSAKINKITLVLEVKTSRIYEKDKNSGLQVRYSGTCQKTEPKI